MDYIELVKKICYEKKQLTKAEALEILDSGSDWWGIYSAAVMVKNYFHQNKMQLNVLRNAKSGLCAEDCGYCAQSKASTSEIDTYSLLSADIIYKKALLACKNQAIFFVLQQVVQDLPKKICSN